MNFIYILSGIIANLIIIGTPLFKFIRNRQVTEVEEAQAVGDSMTARVLTFPVSRSLKEFGTWSFAIMVLAFCVSTGAMVYLWSQTVSSPVFRNVQNSESPCLISKGTNHIFAASGPGRDTEVILPIATGSGLETVIKKIDKNGHSIIITPRGSDTIDGGHESINMTMQGDHMRFVDRAPHEWVVE